MYIYIWETLSARTDSEKARHQTVDHAMVNGLNFIRLMIVTEVT
jgi:hypothetical protein